MLSRRWPKSKWIKHVAAQVGPAHPSSWNVTLYLQSKRTFFFTQSATFSFKNILEPIRPKHDYKMVNESSKSQWASRAWNRTLIATPTTFNITWICLNFLTLMEAVWLVNHHPIYIPPPSPSIKTLIDRVSLWFSSTNTNIGTFYFSIFITTQFTSNFLKLNRSYQYN